MANAPTKGRGSALFPGASRHFRVHERRPSRVAVTLSREGGGEAAVRASVVDMSLGGASLEHVASFAPGERLVLSFASPHRWDPLVVRGTVVWAHPPRSHGGPRPPLARFGVVFEHAGSSDVLEILEMLVSLA